MQDKVTDEMIARYLSGKATPEEESAVLDYMSENDGNLDDLLTITAAVEQFGKRDTERKSHVRSLWPAISAAASVAILIGVGVTLWHNSQSGIDMGVDPAPAYATCDTLAEPNMEDSL